MDYLLNYLTQSGFNASNPWTVFWFIFVHGGFIFVLWALVISILRYILFKRQMKFAINLKWTLLAIDVPKDNQQSPKAVEQIFSQLSGILSKGNLIDKWIKGYIQPCFSLELVSIEGYIQYIIRTPTMFRDVLEAAIYAQYPAAQITEIEDYSTEFTPENFKEKGYTIWGAQFGFVNEEVYPIRTYPLFEYPIAKTPEQTGIVDPMAALLEYFSRMGKGEQAWFQIVIKPVPDNWKDKSSKEVAKILGKAVEKKKTQVDKIMDMPSNMATRLGNVVFGEIGALEQKKEKMEFPSKMLYLSPGERETVEFLDRKASKTGFKCKIRYVYLAKKEIFRKQKATSGVVGALRQFSLLNSNAFKPLKRAYTSVDYWRVKHRLYKLQKKILRNYKFRTIWGGVGDGIILNTEELASLYHFPYKGTMAPSVKKAEAKRAEAPFALPVESAEEAAEKIQASKNGKKVRGEVKVQAEPPVNLPT